MTAEQDREAAAHSNGRKVVNFRLAAQVEALLRGYSEATGRTMVEIVEAALQEYCPAHLGQDVVARVAQLRQSLQVEDLPPAAMEAFDKARRREVTPRKTRD